MEAKRRERREVTLCANYIYDILVYAVQKYIFDNQLMVNLQEAYELDKVPDILSNNIGHIDLKLQELLLNESIVNESLIFFTKLLGLKISEASNLTVKLILDTLIDKYYTDTDTDKMHNKYLKYKQKYTILKQNKNV